MSVAAAVKFVQGFVVGTPGQALFGVLTTNVTVSNGVNTGVVRWVFEVLAVPTGSAVPIGVAQDGPLSTWTFSPDVTGGYLVKVTVYSSGDQEQATDARCFGVPELSGHFIPPFTPRDEFGDAVLNFGGQTRGWAVYLETWLKYVDTLVASVVIDAKDAVRAATVANTALAGLLTIDGVVLGAGDRVLVKNQAAPQDNGIYVAAAGAWARSPDANTSALVTSGMYCLVTEGTTQQDTGWLLTTPNPITLGVTGLTFVQFTGLGSVVAGNGLTKTGNTLDVVGNADGSIVANPNDVQVGVLATDAQHGNRGGGAVHALVVAAGAAGFMSGADKTKIDGLPASAVPTTRTLTAGLGLAGGGDLSADRTFNVGANGDGSIIVNADDVQVGVLATNVQHGNRGGGALHSNVVPAGAAGFMTGADKTKLDGLPASAVPTTRNLTAGAGMTGGGDLSADRTFNVVANADGSIVVNADDVLVGILATDAQHGVRGGGTQHSVVVAAGAAGFMTGADKTKLDGIAVNAAALTAAAPVDPSSSPAAVGVSAQAARSDHKHHYASPASPNTVFAELAANTTTTSVAFVALGLSVSITILAGSFVLIHFTVCGDNNTGNATVFFRVRVDGVVQRATAISQPLTANEASSGAIILRIAGLAVGAHTVDVQWRVSAGTGGVRPVGNPDSDHASLYVQEIPI